MVKKCTRCGAMLSLDCFRTYIDKRRTKPQVRADCKKCEREERIGQADHYREYQREWKRKFYKTEKGIETIKKISRDNVTKRRNDPKAKINHRFSSAILKSIRRNKAGYHWEDLLGFTLKNLMDHLGKQFEQGMTWDNYGKQWHIDHKIPIAAFNYEKFTDIDFQKCWSLENLQPLWATENLCKQDRIERSFQPSRRLSL